jgi:DNA-directed RNA polymerase sigma subunit (sigma70/sigma32)
LRFAKLVVFFFLIFLPNGSAPYGFMPMRTLSTHLLHPARERLLFLSVGSNPNLRKTEESPMTETRKYWIRIDGQPVEVTRKVYADYYNMRRRERYLEERDLDHGKTLYSQLDDGYMTGEDMLPDRDAVPVEEVVEALLMTEKLRKCVALLREAERELIEALFFVNGGDGMTEREYAAQYGVPQKTVDDRRRIILRKLRKMIDE